jgi:HEAT repeat protein
VARRLAFLIGNRKFRPDSGLLPLQGPVNDVAALARLLRDPERGKFEVIEFLDKSHYEVLPDLEQALGSASAGDFLLIYYSGHGMLARNGGLCLATANTRANALRTTSIPTLHLHDLVQESDSNQVLLILDCCYSGAAYDGVRGDVVTALHVVEDARGFYIITASSNTQTARETARPADGLVMGHFTAALVTGIETGAADQGRKGRILLSDLRHYLTQVITGSTPHFFDRKASGDPLISLSPATAAPLLEAGQSAADASGKIVLAALPALAAAVTHRDYNVIRSAADALGSIGPAAVKAVPALTMALAMSRPGSFHAVLTDPSGGDYSRASWQSVADALRKIGPDAVPALTTALGGSDGAVRRSAAEALGNLGLAAVKAVPALVEALNDPDIELRCDAAKALGNIGPDAAAGVPALAAALAVAHCEERAALDKDGGNYAVWRQLYQTAADALRKIGPDAVSTLTAALKDPDKIVRRGAANALRVVGPGAAKAVSALAAALDDPDIELRCDAAEALGNIGSDAVPALVAILNDPNDRVRLYGASALENLGPDAVTAVPALAAALNDRHPQVRWLAADALGKIGPAAADVVPALAATLKDPEEVVRRSASDALRKIEPAGYALPALSAALHDPDDAGHRTFDLEPPTTPLLAVGTPIAERPPHRSERAQFGHSAPTSGV